MGKHDQHMMTEDKSFTTKREIKLVGARKCLVRLTRRISGGLSAAPTILDNI